LFFLSWIATHKTLLGFITLQVFAFSANALLYGSHAAEEARGAVTASGEAGHHHHHPGKDHNEDPDANHCCDTNHSHDVTGSDPFALASRTLCSRLGGVDPASHLLEVFHERFIPPQHQA